MNSEGAKGTKASITSHRRSRSRWGLRVRGPLDANWRVTALRFDPDTQEQAIAYAEAGKAAGLIKDYQVFFRQPNRQQL
jgi:hypothetical protein